MDNGPELTAHALRDWCRFGSTGTAYIEPGAPWQNPYVESFNARVRDELLDVELFDTLAEARVLIADWRAAYNSEHPHSACSHPPASPSAGGSRVPCGPEGGPIARGRSAEAPQIASQRLARRGRRRDRPKPAGPSPAGAPDATLRSPPARCAWRRTPALRSNPNRPPALIESGATNAVRSL